MIFRRPQAIAAIIEQAAYIGEESPAAAERFLDAVESTLKHLERMPYLGSPYLSSNPRLANLRVMRVESFANHLLFYQAQANAIELVHLLHGARDINQVLQEE